MAERFGRGGGGSFFTDIKEGISDSYDKSNPLNTFKNLKEAGTAISEMPVYVLTAMLKHKSLLTPEEAREAEMVIGSAQ